MKKCKYYFKNPVFYHTMFLYQTSFPQNKKTCSVRSVTFSLNYTSLGKKNKNKKRLHYFDAIPI